MPEYERKENKMAGFEFDDSVFDDISNELEHFEVDCPECENSFEISINDIGESVTCPHCGLEILIQSES